MKISKNKISLAIYHLVHQIIDILRFLIVVSPVGTPAPDHAKISETVRIAVNVAVVELVVA